LATFRILIACVATVCFLQPARVLQSQPPADSAVTTAALDGYVKAFLAVSALRSQMQAELADPASKKQDVQAALRQKLQAGSVGLLKSHGLTEETFARMTRRVSTDDAVRKAFEAAVSKWSAGKGPGE